MTRYVDVTPTWEGILPALLQLYEHGTEESKRHAKKELVRMARIADSAGKE